MNIHTLQATLTAAALLLACNAHGQTRAEIDARLVGTNVPELEMREAQLRDAIDFLRDISKLNIVMHPSASALESSITMSVRDISVRDALKLVTAMSGTEYRVSDGFVLVYAPGALAGERILRAYSVPQGPMRSVREIGAKAYLEKLGVPFPEGTTAEYQSGTGRLVVVNTPANIERCDRVVHALGGWPEPTL